MKFLKVIIFGSILIVGLLMTRIVVTSEEEYPRAGISRLSKTQITRIERFINKQMRQGKIPGMAIAVVKDDQVVYKRGFGYANIRHKRLVTSQTLFELGSTSKAFTALGVLYLEAKNKLSVNDPVKKYIPWFRMVQLRKMEDPTLEYLNRQIPWFYSSQDVNITIEQLLLHTSGINQGTISDIPSSDSPGSLEKTVRILTRKAMKPEMDYYPGDRFSYSTINYDILGLIIAKVSGSLYEDFMKHEILNPLGMHDTVLYRNEAGEKLATGYKVGFLHPLEYNAPVYRGNTPAGYVITNADDMSQWLKVQLGTVQVSPFYQKIIERSHYDGNDYNNGWFMYRMSNYTKYWHSGFNPNYASYIEFRPQEKMGIVLLSNTNTQLIQGIGEGIINIINGRGRIPNLLYDMNVDFDGISCWFILALVFTIWLTIQFTVERSRLYHKIRFGGKKLIKFLLFSVLGVFFGILYYYLPQLIFGYNWALLAVWGPMTVLIAAGLLLVELLIVFWYLFNLCFCERKNKKNRSIAKKI